MAKRERAAGAWVVTGAASGFGREFARRLVERGDEVVLWDRDETGLASAGRELGAVHTDVVDVRDADAVRVAAEQSREAAGAIAHAVHCAGVLRVGRVEDVAPADYRLMIEVNYLGSVHVAQALLPELRRAAEGGGRATLMLVASVAGLRGFPELAGYSASKFAVVGFAQALRDEIAGSGVDVRVLCPPPGDTPMVRSLDRVPPVYKLSPLYGAEEVVDAALRGLDRPGFILLIDARSKALYGVARAAPRLLDMVIRRATRGDA